LETASAAAWSNVIGADRINVIDAIVLVQLLHYFRWRGSSREERKGV